MSFSQVSKIAFINKIIRQEGGRKCVQGYILSNVKIDGTENSKETILCFSFDVLLTASEQVPPFPLKTEPGLNEVKIKYKSAS